MIGLVAWFCEFNESKIIREADGHISICSPEPHITIVRFYENWDLQTFLTDVWLDRNPYKNAPDFNCSYLEIDDDLADDLLEFAKNNINNLDMNDSSNEWQLLVNTDLLKAVYIIKASLQVGKKVLYYSWY
ncbi:hypothetical protein [Moraxella sp. ZY200743]|uniref:hypothetical protein n=1 Tax=Moraxella sp. ZY200743 TaxID=2911970 RepID=UPI003D7DD95A